MYHLSDIKIKLDSTKRQHLLLTGKNGSGKTSLLLKIQEFLRAINEGNLSSIFKDYPALIKITKEKMLSASNETERFENEKEYERWSAELKKYGGGVRVTLNEYDGIEMAFETGNFITAYFPAERKAQFAVPRGVEDITLNDSYKIDGDAGNILLKYMVHLKTQQA